MTNDKFSWQQFSGMKFCYMFISFSKVTIRIDTTFGSRYYRMDQVKFVEDSV